MVILFPSYPSRPNQPDPSFGAEVNAAKKAGFEIAFVDLELQLGGDVVLRRLPEEGDVLYRGWLLRPDDYQKLDDAITAKGRKLLTPTEGYREAYEFPRWYGKFVMRGLTAPSTTFPLSTFKDGQPPWESLLSIISTFEGGCILKDYVKSRKQDWFEACFIPDTQDEANVRRVVLNFLRLTEGTISGGLVFREFQQFQRIGLHTKTRMPVINEHRAFIVNGKCIYLAPYWADGDYADVRKPTVEEVEGIVRQGPLASPFYALDLALTVSNRWEVIEVNDGGASGVPEGGDVKDFYQALAQALGVTQG